MSRSSTCWSRPATRVEVDAPLVTLETDKASMDVPGDRRRQESPKCCCKRGDKVSKGSVIARIETDSQAGVAGASRVRDGGSAACREARLCSPRPRRRSPSRNRGGDTVRMPDPGPDASRRRGRPISIARRSCWCSARVPGGYTAAFRAADLGLQVTLVERWPMLGGVCLNVGCIPSKALLHAAKVIEDAEEMGARGIAFGAPEIDLEKLRAWKASVVKKLTGGLRMLAKQRKVEVVQGVGRFVEPQRHRGHGQQRLGAHPLRAVHHRGRLGGDPAAGPARGSAHHRLDRRARAAGVRRAACW